MDYPFMNELHYSSREVRKMLGCTRQFVSMLSYREKWPWVPGSRPRFYLARAVQDYIISRQHTDLANPNSKFRALIRHIGGYNSECPVCKNTSNEVENRLTNDE